MIDGKFSGRWMKVLLGGVVLLVAAAGGVFLAMDASVDEAAPLVDAGGQDSDLIVTNGQEHHLGPSARSDVPSRSQGEPSTSPAIERSAEERYRLPPGTQLTTGTTETPWDLIAPGRLIETFGVENGRLLVSGMSEISYPRVRKCAANYVPPESVVHLGGWRGSVVLDIQSADAGFEVVGASIENALFGDSGLESCITAAYVGVRVPVESVEADRRYRLKYPVVFRFGVTETRPEVPVTNPP